MNKLTKDLTSDKITIINETNTEINKECIIQMYKDIIKLVDYYHLIINICIENLFVYNNNEIVYIIEFFFVIKELPKYDISLLKDEYIYYSVTENTKNIIYAIRDYNIESILHEN